MGVIIVFGTSGCGKRTLLGEMERLDASLCASQLEQKWEEMNDNRFSHLLGKPESERRSALGTALDALNHCKLIGVHATHMVDSMLSSSLPIERLAQLHVDFCVTIHDDLYAVARRLRTQGFPVDYRQILLWRNAEHLLADFVAGLVVKNRGNLPDPPNFWLGVKHAKSSFLRLFQNPAQLKVYAAFSITGVKQLKDEIKKARLIEEITNYRRELLKRSFIVFDPATLEDRILIQDVIHDNSPRDETIQISREERWPYITDGGDLHQPAVDDPADAFPVLIPHAEAFLLRWPVSVPHQPYVDIDAHITQIDLRYVRQADFVTVWRPFNQGIVSTGCATEVFSAAQHKNVIAYSPNEDEVSWRQNSANQSKALRTFWPPGVPLFQDEKQFWTKVDEEAARCAQRPKEKN